MIRQASSAATCPARVVELGGVVFPSGRRDLLHRRNAVDVTVDDDDVLHTREIVADEADLGDLIGVLTDDHLRPRVADDPLAFLR